MERHALVGPAPDLLGHFVEQLKRRDFAANVEHISQSRPDSGLGLSHFHFSERSADLVRASEQETPLKTRIDLPQELHTTAEHAPEGQVDPWLPAPPGKKEHHLFVVEAKGVSPAPHLCGSTGPSSSPLLAEHAGMH